MIKLEYLIWDLILFFGTLVTFIIGLILFIAVVYFLTYFIVTLLEYIFYLI